MYIQLHDIFYQVKVKKSTVLYYFLQIWFWLIVLPVQRMTAVKISESSKYKNSPTQTTIRIWLFSSLNPICLTNALNGIVFMSYRKLP